MTKALILKISLQSMKNKVWRRIAIPEFTTYAQLHEIIQIAFEWENAHLYGFFPSWQRSLSYSANDNTNHEPIGEDAIKYNVLPDLQKGTVTYVYDFSDNWNHQITLEQVADETGNLPRILGGYGEGNWEGNAEFREDIGDEYHPIDGHFPKTELNRMLADWAQSQTFHEVKQAPSPKFNLNSLDWRGLNSDLPNLNVAQALATWDETWAYHLDEYFDSPEYMRIQQYPLSTHKLILANLYKAVMAKSQHRPEQFNLDDWVRGLRTCTESVQQAQPLMTAMVVAVQSMFILLACKHLSFPIFAEMDEFEVNSDQEYHPQSGGNKIIKFPGKQC